MSKRRPPKPGDRMNVKFGGRLYLGTVARYYNGRVHVDIDIECCDEPVRVLARVEELPL